MSSENKRKIVWRRGDTIRASYEAPVGCEVLGPKYTPEEVLAAPSDWLFVVVMKDDSEEWVRGGQAPKSWPPTICYLKEKPEPQADTKDQELLDYLGHRWVIPLKRIREAVNSGASVEAIAAILEEHGHTK